MRETIGWYVIITALLIFSLNFMNGLANAEPTKTFEGSYNITKQGLAVIHNQSFFISSSYRVGDSNITIPFHGVIFIMPFASTNPGGFDTVIAKFADGSKETLGVANRGVPTTVVTKYLNPQAGFLIQPNGTLNLLVSTSMNNYTNLDLSTTYSLEHNALSNIQPPLKQFKSGISAKDVTCKESFRLVINTENNLPACVKPSSVGRLVTQGWALVKSEYPDNKQHNTPRVVSYDIIPGTIPTIPCPHNPQFPSSIVNSSGFDVYNFSGISNYVLYPGHQGTITYKIDRNVHPSQFQEKVNLKNDLTFYHQENVTVEQTVIPKTIRFENGTTIQGFDACYAIPDSSGAKSCYSGPGPLPPKMKTILVPQWNHTGITALSEPESETLEFNISAIVTSTISADSDAPQGTYWLILPPGICGGGDSVLLTIGNQPYANGKVGYLQPP